ncbi:MAG TPA: amino acid adenylation domain-containing protein, partial [Thermoanaerobaculia bacterium]|nr:amino acid adenylation domain-containing protein [Thermoanaerobaculia bacterium]
MTPANAQPTALPTAIDEQLATEREYWLAKLAGELPLSTFPADAPRALLAAPASAASAASTPAEVPLALAPRAAARLVAICGGRDPLLLASLVALVEILLHKVTGHEEIVVGTTIHRRHAELAAFNRLLALRGRIVPEMALKDALQAAKETLAEAFAHQKFPFARLLELLAVEQQQRPALFAVLVLLDSVNDPEHAREAAADARFVFHRDGDGFVGTLEYDARLYRRETLEVMAKHFRTLLDRLLAAPGGTVGELDLLDDADRQQVLYDGNATAAPYPRESTIHALFLEQAARTPRAEALVLGERSMSYGELARRAGQIARFLAGEGIGAGDRVAIFLEHSFAVVEAVLGVLMAGAAYVPLDPEHPKGRLDFLLADSGACLALTSAALAGKLPEGTRTVRLDADREAIERAIDWAMTEPLANDPEAVAYVLYTSGSTGRPKGVKVRHRSLVNYVWWAREVYLQGEPLSFALYTSLAFDLTVTSLFTPLVSGSRLYLYPRREREVPLLDILADDRTEVLKLTPSHLELIKERDNRGSRVRRLIVGGEALSAALARQIAESFGGRVEIDNEYGPTEATVGCMLHRFGPDDDRRAFVPIGRPAANVRLYVLDGALRPVADGLPGELYVGGLCLAEGYLNRDELTAERFLADPFVPGERVYRTGDLARRLPGGILDFLGRSDEQVKIRGHRIELGEIRVALSRHPGVRDSVVRVAEEGEGRELVAYYVARTEIAPEEIRSALAVSLPEEAIPAFFVHLKRLPLTLNGKVNLQALPTLAEIRQRSRPGYVAPRDAAETAMAEIWSVLLGVPQVGAHDNFFQLGGDSIATVRVAARANQAGFQLAPRQIFEFQTLAELTAAIGGLAAPATPGSAIPAIPAIPRRSGSGPAPLSFAQERLWFLDRLVPGSPLYNVPLPLMLYGALDSAALAASLRGLAVRHEPLRTTFAESEAAGGPVQIVAAKPPLPFLPVVDLGSLPADRVETVALGLAREEALRPFDLGRGPLLRATLLRLAEPRHLLLLTLHHIVADGWSMG